MLDSRVDGEQRWSYFHSEAGHVMKKQFGGGLTCTKSVEAFEKCLKGVRTIKIDGVEHLGFGGPGKT